MYFVCIIVCICICGLFYSTLMCGTVICSLEDAHCTGQYLYLYFICSCICICILSVLVFAIVVLQHIDVWDSNLQFRGCTGQRPMQAGWSFSFMQHSLTCKEGLINKNWEMCFVQPKKYTLQYLRYTPCNIWEMHFYVGAEHELTCEESLINKKSGVEWPKGTTCALLVSIDCELSSPLKVDWFY